MKHIKFILTVLVCLLALSYASASSDCGQNGSTSGSIVLYPKKPAVKRPNAPSKMYIICHYGIGFMKFSFPESIQSMTVQISSDDDSFTDFVTIDDPSIEIPYLTGAIEIQCTTDDGRLFIGNIDI